MGKFTESKTKVLKPTTVNDMGTLAYELNPKEELVATILTTFVQKSYYESENDIMNRLKKVIKDVDPKFAAKVALYTRREANMRSSSHVIAGELTRYISGQPWATDFYKRICVRPDDMAEILAYYMKVVRKGKAKKKLLNSMKKGFKAKLESMDPYLIDKYKMNSRDISLIDLVNLMHPKSTQSNAEAYKRLMEGKSLEGLYSTKILDREKSKAGQTANTGTEKQIAKEEAIRDTLSSNEMKNPVMNTLRNLVSVIDNTPDQVDIVCEILTNPAKIMNSRLLPFRFASAYAEVEKIKEYSSGSIVKFEKGSKDEHVAKVLDALEQAMNISCHNIPKLPGNTAILIDHSGSMRGDSGGHSKVSMFSKTTSSVIANLFGSMLMQTQDNVFMGLFGDKLIRVDNLNREKGILATAKSTHEIGGDCGGSSEQGIYTFFKDVVKNKIPITNVIIFSDMVLGENVSWYGRGTEGGYLTRSGSFGRLFKDFRKVNPNANVISVDIRQTKGTSVFSKSMGVTQVAGWSDKMFDFIGGATRGYADIIKEIEAIKL